MSGLSKDFDFPSVASTPQEGQENRKLKVTLLSSEWRSSTDGDLSTINRELAMQLAKNSNVEVSVFLPQCSEEDRNSAASHNIGLVVAEALPGMNPIDCLMFAPDRHVMDCVVGHGVTLGKRALVIRQCHGCKWIQVVHTAPEEHGMYKMYKSISQGEQMRKAEVALCKKADQVVTIGPKLTDAYKRYLHSYLKEQNVFDLTPSIFSEFLNVKQATEERRTFSVLVIGSGDSCEDFILEGYDLAAKAIAELKDISYQLKLVGAPRGKGDDIAQNLLQYGIHHSQLIIRSFSDGREVLTDLFCEVDLAIMPSKSEGFGVSALEALSAGLPVLVSGNSGLGESLKTVPFGVQCVIDSGDPKDWARKIEAVRGKKRSVRLAETKLLQEKYLEMYSWEEPIKGLVERMYSLVFGTEINCAEYGSAVKANVSSPKLSVEIPKMLDLPKSFSAWKSVALPVDILLLTAEDCEFLSCFAYLKEPFRSYHRSTGFVFFGYMGDDQGDKMKIALMRFSKGSEVPGGSLSVAKDAILLLRPKATFSVGACSGLNSREVKLGDVVVSAKLITAAHKTLLGRNIGNLIKHVADEWKAPLQNAGRYNAKVHCDGVVLNMSEGNKDIIGQYPEAIAVEIEGGGVFAAAHDLKAEWVVVKGIKDFADDRQSSSEEWEQIACVMAASVVANILNDPVIFQDWPHFKADLIPASVLARGPKGLEAYRRALERGKTCDRRIKIMLIGQDRSGKTSLRKYLGGETFNEQEPSTDGIEMIPSIKNAGTGAWKNPADLETTSAFHHKSAEVVAQEISSGYKNSAQQFIEEGKEAQGATLPTRETSELVAPDSIETHNPRCLENILKKDIQSDADQNPVHPAYTSEKDIQRNTGTQDVKKEQEPEAIPEKVLFLVERRLKRNDTSRKEDIWPVVWDFAGQAIYHAIHPIFLSQEDVFVLVSDLTQKLCAPAQCRVKASNNDEIVVESPHNEDTNLDHMMRWLDLVHSLARRKVEKKPQSLRDDLPSNASLPSLPPVVVVGTHADGVKNPREEMDFVYQTICNKVSVATGKHISKECFFIDNSNPNREDDPQIVSLREKLLDLSKRMPHINNEIPLQWLLVEERIHQMVRDDQAPYMCKKRFKEDIVRDICQFDNADDVEELLHFLQARGSVIYQDSPEKPDGLVVLNPHWLIRVLSEIITVSPPWSNVVSIQKDYEFLKKRGLLSQQLLNQAFQNLDLERISDSLIYIMEKFVVICDSKNCRGEKYPYFVPCMLTLQRKENTGETKPQNGPLPVFLKFSTKYIPSGLFCRLGALFWKWTSELYPDCKPPAFFANAARFTVSNHYYLELECHRTVIKLAIWTKCDSDREEEQIICEELLSHLEGCWFELINTCHWLRSVTWELCVRCLSCKPCPSESRTGTICIWHEQKDCDHEDCAHYLPLENLDRDASCEYSVDVRPLSPEALKPWTQALESLKFNERKGKRKSKMSPDCSNKRSRQPEDDDREHANFYASQQPSTSGSCRPQYDDQELVTQQPSTSGSGRLQFKQGTPIDDKLQYLASELGDSWIPLGRRLGIKEPKLEDISQLYKPLSEKGYQMLRHWSERNASMATYQILGQALQDGLVSRRELAEKYCSEQQ